MRNTYEVRYFDSDNFALAAEREVGFEKFKNMALNEQLSFKCYLVDISVRLPQHAVERPKVELVCIPIPKIAFWKQSATHKINIYSKTIRLILKSF